MLESSEALTSTAVERKTLTINVNENDVEMEELEYHQECSSLWSIEDDTMFYAQGLKHHSAGKGKSVYVTWNENYLLNFVFKTSSKTGKTSLTKVRISMPTFEQRLEEIANMLILEMNTLLYMKSGRVYYFSSVKSMHKVDWLTGVRCMTSCPQAQFSVIRLKEDVDQKKILTLEVYKDVPQLGKCANEKNILCHTYDISFDLTNLFNCDWLDEKYTLTSFLTNANNITFLKQIVSTGDIFRSSEEVIEIELNQEVHVFTISGNIFVLVGAITSLDKSITNPQVEDFSIRLLNTYACDIECIRMDCKNNLLIVCLQSGHLDIWYKSRLRFDAIFHQSHQIPHFLDYDYRPEENIFYFTTPNDIVHLQIITTKNGNDEKECFVKELRKSIGGMIACTWVESLQQLICLSFNNIFYRINFSTQTDESLAQINENETNYENLNNIYILSTKRVKDLAAKGQIVKELNEQPTHIHHAIEKEFQKQQIISLGTKNEMFKKLFECHLEYHVNMPGIQYFDKNSVQIKPVYPQSQDFGLRSIYALIFVSLKNQYSFLSSVFQDTIWYLQISNDEHTFQLYIPYELLSKNLCLIVDIPLKHNINKSLPNYSLELLTFFQHQSQYLCLKFKLLLGISEKSYLNLFSSNLLYLSIYRNSLDDIETLLKKSTFKSSIACDYKDNYKFKQLYTISEMVLKHFMDKLNVETSLDFNIYYLHQYLIVLKYDASKKILQILSNYPIAIFYIKVLLMYAAKSCSDVEIIDTVFNNMEQTIMNFQSDIEHLYGSLTSVEPEDVNSNSMHLENMRNVYFKLRNEFYDIFR